MKNKVLIVEDKFLIVEEIKEKLHRKNYSVCAVASSGEQAISLICDNKPDVILLDIELPGIDGLETAKKLRKICPTPIVILSSYENNDFIEKATSIGVGAYLVKPTTASELDRAIKISQARFNDLVQLDELNKELQKTIEAKNKLFSIVSHDLRGPLGSFSAALGLLKKQAKLHDEDSMLLHDLENASETIIFLLENLLNWSLSQQNQLKFTPEQINLQNVVKTNIAIVKTQAILKDIEISHYVDDDITVWADKAMLDLILRNLVSNAIKFTPNGGNITVNASEKNNNIAIFVEDTGLGIGAEEIAKITELGCSKIGTNDEKGTGLGLALVKEFVENHDSCLQVTSQLNKGSKFSFKLKKVFSDNRQN